VRSSAHARRERRIRMRVLMLDDLIPHVIAHKLEHVAA